MGGRGWVGGSGCSMGWTIAQTRHPGRRKRGGRPLHPVRSATGSGTPRATGSAMEIDPRLFRCSSELASLASLHLDLGTPFGERTGRAALAGAGALLEVVLRDLSDRPVSAGQLGTTAVSYYDRALLHRQADRLAEILLGRELEPGRRAAIERRRIEVFPRVPA